MSDENTNVLPVNEVATGVDIPETNDNDEWEGYVSATEGTDRFAHTQPGVKQPVPETQPVDNTQLDELAAKLGIKPEELGIAPEAVPEEVLSPDDWYSKQFADPAASKFAEDFKKYVGLDIKEVYGLINNTAQVTQGLEHFRAEVQAERQIATLKSEFGSEFESLMPQVKAEFDRIAQVNPKQAQALDNIDGARYLAAFIKQRNSQKNVPQQREIPRYDLPNVRTAPSGFKAAKTIRQSEMLAWTPKQLDENLPDLLLAKQQGTFIRDI